MAPWLQNRPRWVKYVVWSFMIPVFYVLAVVAILWDLGETLVEFTKTEYQDFKTVHRELWSAYKEF